MAENIKNVNDNNFENEVLKSDIPVLVDFWAAWCAPCHMVTPSLESIASEREGELKVVKLNVDDNNQTASKYGIMSIPSMLLFKDGEVQETLVGALPKEKIEEAVLKHIKS
ncbi:MAG: thioredoxin [Candidatus Aminicenantes bacterium]